MADISETDLYPKPFENIGTFLYWFKKVAKTGTYALLACNVLMILGFILTLSVGTVGAIIMFMWMALVAATFIGLSIGSVFEAFVRYSQYGLSQKHPILNHLVSIIAIVSPIILFPIGCIPTMGLIAYSKVRSPNIEYQMPKEYRPQATELVNMSLLILQLVLIFLFWDYIKR